MRLQSVLQTANGLIESCISKSVGNIDNLIFFKNRCCNNRAMVRRTVKLFFYTLGIHRGLQNYAATAGIIADRKPPF